MASAQFALGTAATQVLAAPAALTQGPAGWFSVTAGTAAAVYLGGSLVTSANGYALTAGGTLTGWLFPGDCVYALTASGTSTLAVLQTGA